MPQNDHDPQDAVPTIGFDAATAVTRTEGGGLAAELEPGWDVGGGVLNGGYLLAVAARAAVLDSPHPHPVALSAAYLRAVGRGPVSLTVVPGPAGRTLAHAQVTLADAAGPCLTLQATTATSGPTHPATPILRRRCRPWSGASPRPGGPHRPGSTRQVWRCGWTSGWTPRPSGGDPQTSNPTRRPPTIR